MSSCRARSAPKHPEAPRRGGGAQTPRKRCSTPSCSARGAPSSCSCSASSSWPRSWSSCACSSSCSSPLAAGASTPGHLNPPTPPACCVRVPACILWHAEVRAHPCRVPQGSCLLRHASDRHASGRSPRIGLPRIGSPPNRHRIATHRIDQIRHASDRSDPPRIGSIRPHRFATRRHASVGVGISTHWIAFPGPQRADRHTLSRYSTLPIVTIRIATFRIG